jgi:ABC-type branched-subunit amino acid transport system permease subunit
MGQLQLDYAFAFGFVGIVGSAVGNIIVAYFIRKYKKTYFVILTLALVIGVSTVLMAYTGIMHEAKAIHFGRRAGFRPLCFLDDI